MLKNTLLLCAAFILFCSHDMFLRMDTHFLQPGQAAVISLYNGTFVESENTIDRDRMIDVSIVSPDGHERQPESAWSEKGFETLLSFKAGSAGTYTAGLSTKKRMIELAAKDFQDYLKHDGILDVMEERKKNGQTDDDANERYSKHVKTIFQVGDGRTNHYRTILNYPIEFVPLSNPYNIERKGKIDFQLLLDGEPLANQLVYVSHSGATHAHKGKEHSHDETKLRTNDEGIVTVSVSGRGHWYVRTISMVRTDDEQDVDYESNWATLTFEVK